MTSYIKYIPILCLLLISCEEEFIVDDSTYQEEIVVEGFIEFGEDALPPYVLLTRTLPFYGDTLGLDVLNSLFVKGADVTVTDDAGETVTLTEFCLQDLPPDIRVQLAQLLGVPIDTSGMVNVDICAYVDLAGEIDVRIGGEYKLDINVNDKNLTATTTIPEHVPIDSIYFTEPPGQNPPDTLAEMNCYITDPTGPNYYRFLTAENDGPLIATFSTVTDDAIFDGQEFTFPISKAEDPNEDVDFETFGLWHIGDSATLKWINIDEEHFRFWETFEFNRNNQGPFSTYTRVSFNVEGGFGIWGGLSSSTYTQMVEIE